MARLPSLPARMTANTSTTGCTRYGDGADRERCQIAGQRWHRARRAEILRCGGNRALLLMSGHYLRSQLNYSEEPQAGARLAGAVIHRIAWNGQISGPGGRRGV